VEARTVAGPERVGQASSSVLTGAAADRAMPYTRALLLTASNTGGARPQQRVASKIAAPMTARSRFFRRTLERESLLDVGP